MNPTRMRTRPSSPTLAQIMGAVATWAAIFALVSSVQGFAGKSGESYVMAGFVFSYLAYLVFLTLVSYSSFQRTHFLVLLAATVALSALMIQAVAGAPEWVRLATILLLPVMPPGLGALMLRYRGASGSEDGAAAETETLATLVRNKRRRGLTPQQPGPPGVAPPGRWLRATPRSRAIAVLLLVALMVPGIELIRRRLSYLGQARYHTREEDRCLEEAFLLDEQAPEAQAEGPPAQALDDFKARQKRKWIEKADWHARKRRAYEGRWW